MDAWNLFVDDIVKIALHNKNDPDRAEIFLRSALAAEGLRRETCKDFIIRMDGTPKLHSIVEEKLLDLLIDKAGNLVPSEAGA